MCVLYIYVCYMYIYTHTHIHGASQVALAGVQEMYMLDPWSGRFLRGGKCNPLQHSCLKNSMDKRSLMGHSPWDCKELDTTE